MTPPPPPATPAGSVAAELRRLSGSLPGESPALDAQLLLATALGRSRAWVFTHPEARVGATEGARLAQLVHRRQAGEPMAYLLGEREFWDACLEVTPAVLVPRPETELLVELALSALADVPAPRVLDLGTGSGAIAIALARSCEGARVSAVERSPAALAVARRNVDRLAPGRVELIQGDWLSPVLDRDFDAVLSNPPYLADDDPHLDGDGLSHEPREALAAGPEGLDDLRRIVSSASTVLVPGGLLAVEHGHEQGAAVRRLLRDEGMLEVRTARDLAGLERVSLGRRATTDAPGCAGTIDA